MGPDLVFEESSFTLGVVVAQLPQLFLLPPEEQTLAIASLDSAAGCERGGPRRGQDGHWRRSLTQVASHVPRQHDQLATSTDDMHEPRELSVVSAASSRGAQFGSSLSLSLSLWLSV